MKKFYLLSILVLVMLFAVGCSFKLQDLGLPFIPTTTITAVPTIPSTPTPTYPPKPEDRTGALQTEILKNEATLLTDTELGYQAVFSPEWLVVVIDAPFSEQLLPALGSDVPVVFSNLLNKESQQVGLRMIALDYTYKYTYRPPGSITITYTVNPAALETGMHTVLDENIEAVPTRMPGSAVTYQDVGTNANGLEYAKMIINLTDEDYNTPIKKFVAIFKISDGLLQVTGTTPQEHYTTLESVFQKVVDSFQPVQ